MKMKYWSEFDKYVVMVHGEGNTPKGVQLGYEAFLDFKRVKEALIAMSKNDSNYSYDGNIYSRVITSSRASQILMKIEECRWDEDIRTVAKQIKAGRMLSPAS
jgi:hypothetical protein|tara:strand:- start:88 stop:396 length:309 start_codon:yes stop_codon:yes gene_type:complete